MRFSQLLCAVFLLCANFLYAAELKPISGTVTLTNSGGGNVWPATVGKHTMELRFKLEAQYKFHVLGGEPTRILSTRFVLDSISVSPPVTYTDPSSKKTYSAPSQFSSSQAAQYGAEKAFDRIKVNDLTMKATFSVGGANATTTIPGRRLLFGEQGQWSMDSTASPSWDGFLDGLDPTAAKRIYETLLRSGDSCSVKMVANDFEFSGLTDFRNAVENSLREQAKNDVAAKPAPARTTAPAAPAADTWEDETMPEERYATKSLSRESTATPRRGSQAGGSAWRGYSGVDRQALEPGRTAIAEAMQRRTELARRRKEASTPSRTANVERSDSPGGPPTSGTAIGVSQLDRMFNDKPSAAENARARRAEQSSAASGRTRVGAGSLKQALATSRATATRSQEQTLGTGKKTREEAKRAADTLITKKREEQERIAAAARAAAEAAAKAKTEAEAAKIIADAKRTAAASQPARTVTQQPQAAAPVRQAARSTQKPSCPLCGEPDMPLGSGSHLV